MQGKTLERKSVLHSCGQCLETYPEQSVDSNQESGRRECLALRLSVLSSIIIVVRASATEIDVTVTVRPRAQRGTKNYVPREKHIRFKNEMWFRAQRELQTKEARTTDH